MRTREKLVRFSLREFFEQILRGNVFFKQVSKQFLSSLEIVDLLLESQFIFFF